MVTTPEPTPDNIAKVRKNLENMDTFVNRYHDWFQDHVMRLYELLQVSNNDPGQAFAKFIISTSLLAIGAVPIPGAKVVSGVLGGLFNHISTDDPDRNLHGTFADVWQRFSTNLMDITNGIARYHDHAQELWQTQFTDPSTQQTVALGDLANSTFPAPATELFQEALNLSLQAGKYDLWKSVLPKRWNHVTELNPPDISYNDENECRNHIKSYIDKNPAYYITYHQSDATYPRKGKVYRIHEHWLGYGFFPYGHREPSPDLCNELFKDDGLGNVVRETSITTRADVFNNWHLPEQHVLQPTYGPYGAEVAYAMAASRRNEAPVRLDGQDLPGVVLQRLDLANADLSGTVLKDGHLPGSDLSNANLQGTELSGADLSNTDLSRARAACANLTDARLDFARARDADLSGATLDGSQAMSLQARRTQLQNAKLAQVVWRGADLRNADLRDADLTGADLAGADLRDADLGGADLSGASLRGTDLSGAKMAGAKLDGIQSAFAVGLPAPSTATAARPVRCLAVDPANPLDRVDFMRVSRALADLTGGQLVPGYGELVETFEIAITTFALFSVPLSAPSEPVRNRDLVLTFGTGGPSFYKAVARQMIVMGVEAPRSELLGQLGKTAGYCPLGYRAEIVGDGRDIHAGFQGPMGLPEAVNLLTEAGESAMVSTAQKVASAIDIHNTMLLEIDFSPRHPWSTAAYFLLPAGNAGAASALAQALDISWSTLEEIDQWLARTTVPYLMSVGLVEGVSGYEFDIYLPYERERRGDVEALLDDEGRARLDALETLTTSEPLSEAYVSISYDPLGSMSVNAHMAYG
jgi:uncharacterized protein YjbI with pentapeptide repeats